MGSRFPRAVRAVGVIVHPAPRGGREQPEVLRPRGEHLWRPWRSGVKTAHTRGSSAKAQWQPAIATAVERTTATRSRSRCRGAGTAPWAWWSVCEQQAVAGCAPAASAAAAGAATWSLLRCPVASRRLLPPWTAARQRAEPQRDSPPSPPGPTHERAARQSATAHTMSLLAFAGVRARTPSRHRIMLACAVLAFATASLGQATGSASTARKTAADKQRERRLKVGREALELSALERADEREEWPNQIDASKPEGHCDGDCSDGRGRYVVAEETGYTVYHGEFVDGQPAGMGLLRYADNTTLEGNWVDGACRGYCQWISAGGDVFEGELIDGIRAGYGELRSPAAGTLYRGDWSENQYSGPGELIIVLNSTTDAAAVFSGVFEAGDLNGFGSHTWEQQVTSGEQNYALHPEYRGHWEASKYSGRGELVWAPGVAQAGSWLAGHFVEEDTVKRSAAQIKIDVTEIYHAFNRSFESDSSRRRDCHSADPL